MLWRVVNTTVCRIVLDLLRLYLLVAPCESLKLCQKCCVSMVTQHYIIELSRRRLTVKLHKNQRFKHDAEGEHDHWKVYIFKQENKT